MGDIQVAITNRPTVDGVIVPGEEKSYYDLVFVGDWGCTEETEKTVKNIPKRDPNVIIALGDYSYSTLENAAFIKLNRLKAKPCQNSVRKSIKKGYDVAIRSSFQAAIQQDADIMVTQVLSFSNSV